MNPDQIEQITKVALAITSVAGAVVGGILIPLAPIVLPLIARKLKSAEDQLVFDAVSRAVVRGASAGNAALQEALRKAADPASPGGKEITQDERVGVLAAAATAAWQDVQRQGVKVDEATVREAARAKMDCKLREQGI